VRKSIIEPFDDSQPAAPATHTVIRNGTVFEQKVKTVFEQKVKKTPDSGRSSPRARPPEQSAVAVTRVDELLAENATLREELNDLKADLREKLADNEDMARII
jgi:uncharacterized small protein (DUF1192 family)